MRIRSGGVVGKLRLALIVMVGIGGSVVVLLFVYFGTPEVESERGLVYFDGGGSFVVDVARSARAHRRGLGGVDDLGLNEGMLFVFGDTRFRGFWMKDMLIDIDIVWIDDGCRVTHIYERVPAQMGASDEELVMYHSPTPVLYVLEVGGGGARREGVEVGDYAVFKGVGECAGL